ncbi:DMT family transporter [Flavobacterium sp. GSP27]|uniref:DMT family transporter n=1 Tax=Flavobacterium bomense TaxID=2497483 RepID=A0A3S0PYX0_9FLAO|nr:MULTISPECIES: DMT family transporter [Flavobacterium]RTY94414.1 DMT family transporter [Flavobacterium sp. GSN2]RTY85039.1 DMT family transporter [Flavobacterium sp. LS1P28]RTY89900.1 DMT family transporter [Flavobacterium sp. RSP46]RTZ08226.1 DMT family transporter [Flavobacterium bomense]RTZ09378.1 DMT family transporter [Flavobacterium sp. GSP6]
MESKQLKWVYLLVLALVWGSSFILIKKGLIGLTALQLGSLRIIFAAVFLILIGFKSLSKIPVFKWKYIALTSLFGTFIPAYLFAIAQTEIDSSVSSILNSLTPLNTLILGALVFGLQFKRNQIFGILIGLLGSALLILNGAMHHPEQNYYYAILVLIASICYAVNVNLIKKYLHDLSPLSITTGNFMVLFFPAFIILFFSGFFEVVHDVKVQESILFIMVLGVVGTGIANILFFKLIQMSSPVFATSVTYLIPVVAFCWGLLDNEMLTPVQFFGAFIILIGVYLSAKK